MSVEKVDDYAMNAPKPYVEPEPEQESDEDKMDELKIEPVENEDIFIRPKEKIVNAPKPRVKRPMSEKQKAHLQNLISRNKQRAEDKKEKLREKLQKKEEKKQLLKEKRLQKKLQKEQEQPKQSPFVNDLRKVDKSPSKTGYYNDMERMFGLFSSFQEKQSQRNEELINKRVEERLNKNKGNREKPYNNTDYRDRPAPVKQKPKPQAYKIDFSQYSHSTGFNPDKPYGY